MSSTIDTEIELGFQIETAATAGTDSDDKKMNKISIWMLFGMLAVSVIGSVLLFLCWEWLQSAPTKRETNGETLRNAALLLGGIVALIFGIWRSMAADRQADAAKSQADAAHTQVNAAQTQIAAAQAQVDTARRSLMNERYQNGAEMLGSDVMLVRLGGIFALQNLGEEHPIQFHIQIMRIFCAFATEPISDNADPRRNDNTIMSPHSNESEIKLRSDVQLVIESIARRGDIAIQIENGIGYRPDLSNADLSGLKLGEEDSPLTHNLSNTDFWEATLSKAHFANTSLRGTWYGPSAKLEETTFGINTDLTGAAFVRTDMSSVDFYGTNLSGVQFSIDGVQGVRNLTQEKLFGATADPNNPPKLDGLTDPETGDPLLPPDDPPENP